MDVRITIEILITSILIAFCAFFSYTETALISVNKIRIRYLADTGNKNAKILVKLLEKPERFLTAILIGNNIVNITASVLAADIALLSIEKLEREIIHNLFEFSDRKAIDVMTPREKMTCINESKYPGFCIGINK